MLLWTDFLCYFTGAVKVEKLASKISVSRGIFLPVAQLQYQPGQSRTNLPRRV